MLTNLVHGLTDLGNVQSVIYLLAGSLGGVLFGVIPGLGGVVILSVVLALINHISLEGTLCLFLGVQAASFFSSSISAILLNTPAHAESFAVALDGFPMAQRGQAGRALGISATATCVGGIIGCIALVGFYQVLNSVTTIFHPPEFVALIALALVLIGTLGTESVGKGLMSSGLGVMIASIGPSVITGIDRYTFGSTTLLGGIDLVSLALGLFAVPQMILVFGTATRVARQDMTGKEVEDVTPVELGRGFSKQIIGGVVDTFRHWVILLLSSLVGVITGIIPGIGAFAANFLSYGLARQTSKNRALFGTGIAEGIIAPEGSSLSKEAGGMIPILGLGIPGGAAGALFLAAVAVKGVKIGYNFTINYPVIPYEVVWIIALSGIIGTLAGVIAAPVLAKVTKVPGPLLVPLILALSILGAFIATQSFFCVMECLIFGVIGLGLRRLGYSLASFIVGLVLGPTFEANVYLTHNIYKGVSFLKLPLTDAIFALTAAFLVAKAIELRGIHRAEAARERAEVLSLEQARSLEHRRNPYPLLALVVTAVLSCLATAFTVYGILNYGFVTAIMPVLGGSVVAATAWVRLPYSIRDYRRYQHLKHMDAIQFESTRISIASKDRTEGDLEETPQELLGDASIESVLLGAVHAPLATGLEPNPDRLRSDHEIVIGGWGRDGQYLRELVCIGWFGSLVLLCWLFGFKVGIPVFSAAYSLSATRRVLKTIWGRLAFGIVSAGLLWLTTYELMKVLNLPFMPHA